MSLSAQRRGRRLGGRAILLGALLVASLVALLVAGLAIAAGSGGHSAPIASQRVVGLPARSVMSYAPHTPPPGAARAARTFLSGYIAYLVDEAEARQIRDAAPALIAVLAQGRPSVTPAARRVHQVIVALGAREARGRVLHLTALIRDGHFHYPIRFVISHDQRGWEVTQLSSAE